MTEKLSGLSKKNDMNLWETESFLKRRKSYDDENEADNTPWLITFADLMTILLVFSFVLFAVNHKEDKTASTEKRPADTSTSLVPVAHANTIDHTSYLTIPLDVNSEASEAVQSPYKEKTILKKSFFFDSRSATLDETLKSGLNSMAEFSKKNPTSKIIITSNIDGTSTLLIKRAMNIVDYFVDKCAIEKKRIFLQSLKKDPSITASTGFSENISKDRTVEVKLIKTFWWF